MPLNVGSAASFKQVAATPSTPPAGHQSLYIKSNGDVATENSSGVEQIILDGTDWLKQNCRAATTANITLSAPQSIDSVSVVAGDRVLVKNQATTAQNGIYVVAAGSWTRSLDANTSALIASAATTVTEGTTNAGRTYQNKFKATDTLGTTGLDWWYLVDNLAGSLLYLSTGADLTNLTSPIKSWVRVATTANITLSGTQTVDGTALIVGDRVLVKNQTSAGANGIYTVSAGAWSRTVDGDTVQEFVGAVVPVNLGTVNAGTVWETIQWNSNATLGTTAMNWEQSGTQTQVTTTAPSNPQIGDMYYDTTAGTYTSAGAASLSGNNTFTGSNGFLAQTQFTPNIQLTSAYTTTTPSGGSTTGTNIFVRHKARNTLAYADYLGEDHRVQDSLYANSWQWVQAVNNNATPSTQGVAVTVLNNAGAAATAVALASTSFYTGRKRFRVASTTTAGTAGELRSNTADSYISATANDGGFHFVARFGLNTVATNTRGFIGLNTATTAYPAGSNPGAGLNQIGFYWDTGMTTIHFINSSGTLGTSVDMGANFPTSTSAATYFYEAGIWFASASSTVCNFSITRLNDSLATATTAGTTGSGTNFPAAGTLLAWHLFYGNGSNAAAHSMDIQSVYLLSDN